jgi:23S rRNA (pseudouridine1915-N3)-methyltransferase
MVIILSAQVLRFANILKSKEFPKHSLMKVTLLLAGETEEKWLREGLEKYAGRIKKYVPFGIREVPAGRYTAATPPAVQKRGESEALLRQLAPEDIVILLDEHGTEMSSVKFSAFLNKQFLSGQKHLVFIAGGAYGFDDLLRKRAGLQLSLSRMTFPHQLVRLIFTEQLYRALTILRNENYHHE